jgi:hypothetical protein
MLKLQNLPKLSYFISFMSKTHFIFLAGKYESPSDNRCVTVSLVPTFDNKQRGSTQTL